MSAPSTSRPNVARLLRLAVVVAVAVAGAGCGSGSDKPSTSSAAGAAQPPAASNTTASTMAAMPASAPAPFPRLEPAAFADRIGTNGTVLINVHVPYEGELARTDAFIPYDHIMADNQLPKDKNTPILLYCRTGHMSLIAGNALHDAGYTDIADLNGGMKAWEASGHELIQNPAHAAPPMESDHKM